MKWQQGRIVNGYDDAQLVGRTLWVEVGKPLAPDGLVHEGPHGDFINTEPSYRTNLEWKGSRLKAKTYGTELTNVFADDVRIVTYEQFLAGDDGTIH